MFFLVLTILALCPWIMAILDQTEGGTAPPRWTLPRYTHQLLRSLLLVTTRAPSVARSTVALSCSAGPDCRPWINQPPRGPQPPLR